MPIRISGVVHTKDEERRIARALKSLANWCDELVVVDMNSADKTVDIARSLGARVIAAPDYGYADRAYALGIDAATGEWIMRLDADEVVPARLAQALRRLADADEVDAVEIPRLNYFFGKPILHAGWGPESDRLWRFFRRSVSEVAVGPAEVHSVREPLASRRVTRLAVEDGMCLLHFNYVDWAHFVAKLNQYTTIEAQELIQSGRKLSVLVPLKSTMFELLRRGVRRRAWRDGYRGVVLVWMQMTYKLLAYVKARQLAEVGGADAVLAVYDELAEHSTISAPEPSS